MTVRWASHAGSWYPEDGKCLSSMLEKYISDVPNKEPALVKAIISPHAGYRYCGATGGHSWKFLRSNPISRVVIFGPSHHFSFYGCGLPDQKILKYDTPLGELELDREFIDTLRSDSSFIELTKQQDEDEHSIEMQLPVIKHVFKNQCIKIVPIVVGHLSRATIASIVEKFQPLIDDPDNRTVFVISSDFCHWGSRFRYTFLPSLPSKDDHFPEDDKESISARIHRLDKEGIDYIVANDCLGFVDYLNRTENTICGRNPIRLLLELVKNSPLNLKSILLDYSQSSKVVRMDDSSVSYAAMVTVFCEK